MPLPPLAEMRLWPGPGAPTTFAEADAGARVAGDHVEDDENLRRASGEGHPVAAISQRADAVLVGADVVAVNRSSRGRPAHADPVAAIARDEIAGHVRGGTCDDA